MQQPLAPRPAPLPRANKRLLGPAGEKKKLKKIEKGGLDFSPSEK